MHHQRVEKKTKVELGFDLTERFFPSSRCAKLEEEFVKTYSKIRKKKKCESIATIVSLTFARKVLWTHREIKNFSGEAGARKNKRRERGERSANEALCDLASPSSIFLYLSRSLEPKFIDLMTVSSRDFFRPLSFQQEVKHTSLRSRRRSFF